MCGLNHKYLYLTQRQIMLYIAFFECNDWIIIIYICINELYGISWTNKTNQRTVESAGNTLQVILEELKLEAVTNLIL